MNLILGSHVSMSKKNKYLVGAVKEMLEYNATTLMIYTGPPQNTKRTDLELMDIKAGLKLAAEHGIDSSNFVIHAPYIINLATFKEDNRKFATQFLIEELRRAAGMGIDKVVLHPGSFVGQTLAQGIEHLINSLNFVLQRTEHLNVTICLETMAGKGNEIGRNFEELAAVIQGCNNHRLLGVCLDTCHVHDAGYDLRQKEQILTNFDQTIGLDRLKVLHINDSKNSQGSRKDRHENIGYGKIGFKTLLEWIYEPKFVNLPKILETPFVEISSPKNPQALISVPPYKYEIEAIKQKQWKQKLIGK
ncbi:deoxyribonuclease-4 [Mycoplasmoides fastidiosum]|uniref:Probable endonuclease 4 n=1 Tax=Mycoplasmoides fastidiosum TaxID=92758 RepID=A0ABU0M091_9BACT|nr:deoxyribonuclease IV [Mycoplasmoides fastidiosum]MDQ0514260.1 deoxyribonuclease-4 [Mycoplasmoides fastidiosum]UUD37332.1 deoxyribonuclease IV [Mycoplasmoides fastidiosum]